MLWGEAGTWAHDTFMALNAAYFADEVPYRGVVWGLTPHGKRLGHTLGGGRFTGRITLHPALLDPHSDAWGDERHLGEAYARDVLLHEMMHGLLLSRGDAVDEDSQHNTEPWCAEIMRLALLLGLGELHAAPVHPRRVDGRVVRQPLDGYLPRAVLATFPHAMRPPGWYEANRGRLPVPI